jgi:hypothetical protein
MVHFGDEFGLAGMGQAEVEGDVVAGSEDDHGHARGSLHDGGQRP